MKKKDLAGESFAGEEKSQAISIQLVPGANYKIKAGSGCKMPTTWVLKNCGQPGKSPEVVLRAWESAGEQVVDARVMGDHPDAGHVYLEWWMMMTSLMFNICNEM